MAVRKIKTVNQGEKLEEDFNVRTVVEKTLKEVEVKEMKLFVSFQKSLITLSTKLFAFRIRN